MNISFFDDSAEKPKMREDVRINDILLEVSPEGRRLAVDFDLTPFIERPSINIRVINGRGEKAGALTVIETLDKNFGVIIHLRDQNPTETYQLQATLYYASIEAGTRQEIQTLTRTFTVKR